MITLSEADAGGRHEVHVGDDVVVRLAENPTTGHRWHIAVPPDGVTLADDNYHADGTARPGSGGTREFLLRADKPGTHQVSLLNKRSWEGAGAAAASLGFTLHVLP